MEPPKCPIVFPEDARRALLGVRQQSQCRVWAELVSALELVAFFADWEVLRGQCGKRRFQLLLRLREMPLPLT